MKAIICGAGIGGLCTALALSREGWQVTVLEQATALTEAGAGLQLGPNAMAILDEWGLRPQIESRAFEPEFIELKYGISGASVGTIPLGDHARQRWGAAYLHIHRADLLEILGSTLRRTQPEALQLGQQVCRIEDLAHDVMVGTASGNSFQADLLVGADGIHSTVREHLFGAESPRFTGNVAWRLVVPTEQLGEYAPPPGACIWMGPGKHAVTYRLRGGELSNLVAVVEQDGWQEESWVSQGPATDAGKAFSGWHPVITGMLSQAETLNRWALFDRPPLPLWHRNHVTLLGDACHPMLPFLAQGAAMAIEDSLALSRCLKQENTVMAALETFQQRRWKRTTRVQRASRRNAGVFHRRSALARALTAAPIYLASRFSPALFHSRFDWLYGHREID